MKKIAVTGGGGFIGAYLVKRLVRDGWSVSVIDSMIRGDASRFAEVSDDVRLHSIDVRDEDAVTAAITGCDVVMHLAAINGTENFYKRPELVLDVGIRGAIAVVNACRRAGVFDLVVASTAEVYQTPAVVPTPETVALTLPDSLNPRYSYGGSKIASELIAFNYAQEHFRKVQVFRPHNIYGPDMGWKHVVPQFILRAAESTPSDNQAVIPFEIQGDGSETRAFCYVEDAVDGILKMYSNGEHREIYHIGNDQEVSIRGLVETLGSVMGLSLAIRPSPAPQGGTPRRCPDISKMRKLGYSPAVDLAEGLRRTCEWYLAHRDVAAPNDLM
ncbi:NAD-dependent epimerase/dehydratase family protein [Phreatobacter oligotrophus]|uniref:UDP-glucose 4-epimerase n=1 Tax=Phreatobacter oligotrophus TaxID=1122261 RepID=A0A2T4YP55_9HYPH|nr:NAD-dependent epimerase/dehydratase family protein [Phreatobacter oligotrophus]PTM45285.1 UDP-glucose 4-epimerase [Phreatobacter oligotrophus]